MLNVFLQLLILLVCAIILYRVLVQVVSLYKGIPIQEAEKKIHNFINDEPEYHLHKDEKFCKAIENTMEACLDKEHFSKLKKLSEVEPIYQHDIISGVHAIRIYILSYKLHVEEVNHLVERLKYIAGFYLRSHGLPSVVQAEMMGDCIMLQYAETQKEKQILDNIALSNANKIKTDTKKIEAYKMSKK